MGVDNTLKSTVMVRISSNLDAMAYRGNREADWDCLGTYETDDGTQRSLYTLHLYLNDSVAGLNPDAEKPLIDLDLSHGNTAAKEPGDKQMLEGGATTFHSRNMAFRLDVHPKAGRVLIFQQKRLLHSGDDVVAGMKYTVRGDIMYRFEMNDDDGGVVFG